MTDHQIAFDRRNFLQGALGAAGAGLALTSPFAALGARAAGASGAAAAAADPGVGYGPLFPARDQTTGLALLNLPRGFEYMSLGWRNDMMSDGVRTPSAHDGMAAFRDGDVVRLVRNHERGVGTPFAPAGATYDPQASGGTTTLVFDPDKGELVEDHASLSGTIRNCAGGLNVAAKAWLSCEETTDIVNGTRHGYVFQVPVTGTSDAVPIKGMGRFSHEANATDPATGIVYLTEDGGSSALYRYLPVDPADLHAGGVLQAMALDTTDTRLWATGQAASASWVVVDNPDWGPGEPSTWQQAQAKGAARIVRGEGAWYSTTNSLIYMISTSGGATGQGQVFSYDPLGATFTCVFASPSGDVLNNPDNVTVSPRGGLVLCEDGSGREYLHGLTPDGQIFRFAENNIVLPPEFQDSKGYSGDFSDSEWAGATFEPKTGNWLFVNIQSPGVTFAITGPWRRGAL